MIYLVWHVYVPSRVTGFQTERQILFGFLFIVLQFPSVEFLVLSPLFIQEQIIVQ